MKQIPSYSPFSFQADTIKKVIEIAKNNNGVCIFDETGLGKTITAATAAINLTEGRINVLSTKSNQRSWNDVLENASNPFNVFTYRKPPITPCDVLIIDEAHNIRNEKSSTFLSVFEYIKRYNPIVLLLTATPFQNNIREFRNVISLINFKTDTPAFVMLGFLFERALEAEKKIAVINRFDDGGYENITKRNENEWTKHDLVSQISKVIMTFSVRNTRDTISQNYSSDVEMMGHFPSINIAKLEQFFSPDETIIIGDIISVLHKMNFAVQNSPFYSNHPRYKTNTAFAGLMKTLLLKRLDSSVHAFRKSLEKMMISVEETLSKENHTIFIEGLEYSLSERFVMGVMEDKRAFEKLLKLSESLSDQKKLDILLQTISNKKAVVFTEYKDTLEIIEVHLRNNNVPKVVCYSSESSEALLDRIADNFDANNCVKDDINILCATDVLAEGINLHKADVLVHFDQKWNPSKLTQRNGRVNRITKNGVSRNINIFTFQVESIIEGIIELDKKIATKEGLAYQFLSESPLALQELPEFHQNTTMFYETDKPNPESFIVFGTYMGHILLSNSSLAAVIRDKCEFSDTTIETPDSIEILEYSNELRYIQSNYLLSSHSLEFNQLYRDAWYELAKLHSKGKPTVCIDNIDFFRNINREDYKIANLWLNKKRYGK